MDIASDISKDEQERRDLANQFVVHNSRYENKKDTYTYLIAANASGWKNPRPEIVLTQYSAVYTLRMPWKFDPIDFILSSIYKNVVQRHNNRIKP
jgi:hypothetical protein